MDNILITGGTGTLGKQIVKQLLNTAKINVISTKGNVGSDRNVTFHKADIANLASLQAAVNSANVIIHCASNPANAKSVDVDGTRNLLKALNKAEVKHLIYISIAGVGNSQFPYYVLKREAEQLIETASVPFTILRATQFHDFVLNRMILPFDDGQNLVVPAGLKFQSIDIIEVAAKVKHLVASTPANGIITIGGPEVLTIEDMALTYLHTLGRTGSFKTEMMPGERFDMLRSGVNLCKDLSFGKITWQQYLDKLVSHDKI